MKQSIFAILIILSVTLNSCREDKKEDIKKDLPHFKITFNLVSYVPDSLQLFYVNDTTWSFKEEQSIWQPIIGDSTIQVVSFDLPSEINPTFIRLDFTNKNQKEVKFSGIKIEYNDKVFAENDSILKQYFTPNNLNTIDSLDVIQFLNNEPFDPFIYSGDGLKQKLSELTK